MNKDSAHTGERMTHGENLQNGQGSSFLIGVLTGAIVGVGLGVLFAPRAGSEFRSQVGGLSTTVRKAASRRYRQARERVDETVAGLSENGQELRGSVWNAVARGAQKVEAYATDSKSAFDREPEGPSGPRSPTTVSRGFEDPVL
jgi:gas vesicle protein